ncbi:MAG: hypothetical protein SGBAC_012703 [Bacillariaceae sp.]
MNQHKSETIAYRHHPQSEPDIKIDPKLAVDPTTNFVNQDKGIIAMESKMDQMSKEIRMLQKERAEMKTENEKLRQRIDGIQQSKQGEAPQAVLISDSHLASSESSKTPPPPPPPSSSLLMFPLYIDANDNEFPIRTTVHMWNSRTNVVKGAMLELLAESTKTKNGDGPTSSSSQPRMIRGYYNPQEYSKPNDFRPGDELVAVDYRVFLPGGSCATTRQEYGIVSVSEDLGWAVDPGNIRIGRLGVVGSWYADFEYTFEVVSPIQSLWTDAVDIEIEYRTTEDGNYQPLVATNPDDQSIRKFPFGPVSGIVHVNFKAASFTNLNGLVTHRDGGGLHVAFCANNDSGNTPNVVVPPLQTMAPTIVTPSPTVFSNFDGPYATEPVQEVSSNKVTVEGIEELGRFFTVSVDLFPIQINTNENERFRTTVRVTNARSGITKGVMMELVPDTDNLRGYYNPEEYTIPGDFAVGDELVLIDYEPLLSADGECIRREYGIAAVDQELGWNVPPSNIRIGKLGVIGPWYDDFEFTFYLESPVTSMWSDAVFANMFYNIGNGFLPLNARQNSPTIRDFEAPVSGAVKVRFENAKIGTLNGLVTQRDAGGLHVTFCTHGSTGNSTPDVPPPPTPQRTPLPSAAPVDSSTHRIEVEVAITGDNVVVERIEEEGKYFWVSAANFPVAIKLFENPKQKLVIRGNNTSAIARDKNRGLKGMVFYYYPDTNSYRGNYNPFEYAKSRDFAVGDLIAMDDYSTFVEGSCDRKDYRIVGMENLDLPDGSVGWNIPLSSIRIGKEGVVGGSWKDMEYTVYLDDPVSTMWTDAVDATIDIQVSLDGGISYNSIPATGSDPTLRPLGSAISGYLKIKFLGANFRTLNNLVTAREAGGLHIAFC